jgi:cytidylate kinase
MIIAFGGSSQTGKTTLARRLADFLSCKFVSFGDYVRSEARKRGTAAPTRANLQDLGQELIQTDVLAFCRNVLDTVEFSPGEPLVIDGVRHREALDAISKVSCGESITLIYLHAPIEVRAARKGDQRGESDGPVDTHPVESQTNSEIRNMASLVVDASGDVDQVFRRITNWIREKYPEGSEV